MESSGRRPILLLSCFLLILFEQVSAISYNQLKICPNASWNANATTFANNNTIGNWPYVLFIDTNNTIFTVRDKDGRILIWRNASVTLTTTISTNRSYSYSMFITDNEEIFLSGDYPYSRVDRWKSNGTRISSLMSGCSSCSGLFIDLIGNLYCSQWSNQVVRQPLESLSDELTIVAGTGCWGSAANMLSAPRGIFVTTTLDLYVADCGNDRVQLFREGQRNATTVAGNGSTGTIALHCPTGIVLDDNGYLFIVDSSNHRIVGQRPDGFRCLVGCSGQGSASNQLYSPQTMSFDQDGNIFVMDYGNCRIQKFRLTRNTPDSTTFQPVLSTQSQPDQPTSTSMVDTTQRTMVNQNSTMMTLIPSTQKQTAQLSSSTKFITTQTLLLNQLLTLIPSLSNLSFPIQFRRNQDFYFTSNVELNCNTSLFPRFQWVIYNCSSSNCLNNYPIDPTVIDTTSGELYIPSRTLAFGIYELKLTVTIALLSTSKSAFVRITPSGITANLVLLGTSMITSGAEKDLQLNPGLYSFDLDQNQFNASEWNYQYYCRIYGYSNFPNIQGSLIPLDDSRIDLHNPSCLNNSTVNGSLPWSYAGVRQSLKSSLILLGGSLRANRTYQLMVFIENKRNNSVQGTGFLLIRVEQTFPQMIAIGCVITTLCVPNLEFQLINPTTQVALFSLCLGICSNQRNVTWNIYYGSPNASQNLTEWFVFNPPILSVFGVKTENFTATKELFLLNPSISHWRFEVVYSFPGERSSSSLNFLINSPPRNGSCSISPDNGTTLTLFSVSCPSWFDEDGIQDDSLYRQSDSSFRTLIAFSPVSMFDVRLPSLHEPLRLSISIRDQRDCLSEWTNISSISVRIELGVFDDLFQNIDERGSSPNPFVRLLKTGNQNQVGQVITSLSEHINQLDKQNQNQAVSSGVPASSISISSLGSSVSLRSSSPLNLSALTEFEKELNLQANLREYLSGFLLDLPINTLRNIQIQSTSLLELTQSTNQLTRSLLTIASERCFRLASVLNSLARRISREEVQMSVTQLLQSATNILTAVNGPLQGRMKVLEADFAASKRFPSDYESDLESEWIRRSERDDQNLFDQEELSSRVLKRMNEVSSLLSKSLKIHLNLEQQFTLNTSNVFMSIETLKIESILGKEIPSVGEARLRLPSIWNLSLVEHQRGSLKSTLEPLPSFGSSSLNTNLSRSISLTWMDEEGNEIPLRTNVDHPLEIFIPRDPSLIVPPFFLQNVTGQRGFNFHYLDLNPMSSIHFDIHPSNINLSFAFVYRFDRAPILNTSRPQMDGWTIFAPSNLTNGNRFRYFLDNEQTLNHQSMIFALRQLNESSLNPPWMNEHVVFTSNYELRLYTSSCFYFDEKAEEWKSDGLKVGPETNHFQTQCLSTHI